MSTRSESGQGLTEYALIIAFVAIVVVVFLAVLGPKVAEYYSTTIATIHAYTGY